MSLTNEERGLAGEELPWPVVRAIVLLRDEFTCAICGQYATQADHIYPQCFGGSDHPLNLQALCTSCNQRKGRSRLYEAEKGANLRDFAHLTLEQLRHYSDEHRAHLAGVKAQIRLVDQRADDLESGSAHAGEPLDLVRHGLCPTCSDTKAYVMHADECPAEVDRFKNPLVCDCAEPDADPRRNFGECSKCRRKPLALMGVGS